MRHEAVPYNSQTFAIGLAAVMRVAELVQLRNAKLQFQPNKVPDARPVT